MKLLVLGSSGRCGHWVVKLAADRGHEVIAVVREQTEYTPPAGVHVERGDVLDGGFLTPLLAHNDVVISCLGLRRASILPWSRLLSPEDLVTRVSSTVAACSQELRRFIWISAGGVGSSLEQTSSPVRLLIRQGKVGLAYRDLNQAERVMEPCSNALAVRPVTLVSGAPTGRARAVERYGLLSTVRRSDVAEWMVNVADKTQEHPHSDILLGST